jgi:hypothetical protein
MKRPLADSGIFMGDLDVTFIQLYRQGLTKLAHNTG